MIPPDEPPKEGGEPDPVPDALDPPRWNGNGDSPHDVIFTDPALWGGEAVVREGDYAPHVPSRFPDAASVAGEVRELEHRVRARLTPVFPLESRRPRPLRTVWKRYRQLALEGRSTVVDEMGRDPAIAARFAPVLDFLHRRYFRTSVIGI